MEIDTNNTEHINTDHIDRLTLDQCEEILYAWDKMFTIGSGNYPEDEILRVRELVRNRLDILKLG